MSFIIDLEKAADPATSSALLSEMWHAPIDDMVEARAMRKRVAANPNISSRMASEFVYWRDYQCYLLQNPALPLWIIEGLTEWNEPALRRLFDAAIQYDSPLKSAILGIFRARFPKSFDEKAGEM